MTTPVFIRYRFASRENSQNEKPQISSSFLCLFQAFWAVFFFSWHWSTSVVSSSRDAEEESTYSLVQRCVWHGSKTQMNHFIPLLLLFCVNKKSCSLWKGNQCLFFFNVPEMMKCLTLSCCCMFTPLTKVTICDRHVNWDLTEKKLWLCCICVNTFLNINIFLNKSEYITTLMLDLFPLHLSVR